ncbi:hypothetical protein TNCV_129291 [Trichonephila clavipes]|nr:hypothetical protein TNCV_129291 [Trichonephila clavipes]
MIKDMKESRVCSQVDDYFKDQERLSAMTFERRSIEICGATACMNCPLTIPVKGVAGTDTPENLLSKDP